MLRVSSFFMALCLFLGACTGGQTTLQPIEDPVAALAQAVETVREQTTFRLLIEQIGVAYAFQVSLDSGLTAVSAIMRRGEAQFMAPEELYATVKLEIPPLPAINTEIFAKGPIQWFRLAGGNWINFPIAEGFDPGELVRPDGGFAQALGQLRDVQYIGTETLIDGTITQHIRGFANGDTINDLMFNLLRLTQNNVQVDVFLNPETNLPARILITLPDTASESEGDTQWNLEIYDLGAPAEYRTGEDGNPQEVK